MKLSAPTNIIFIISAIIAILGILAGVGVLSVIPVPAFWLVVIGYVILALGCMLKGI